MMNKSKQHTGIFVLALVSIYHLESSYAFQIQPRLTSPSKHSATSYPFREVGNDIDLDLAEDCARNLGHCSVEELEHCRDELHAHRVQHVAFGDNSSPDIIKERFLETELTMQLESLKKHMMIDSYLFAEENGVIALDLPPREGAEPSNTKIIENKRMMMWKELVEDGALESLAICGMLGFMMMAPRVF